MRILKLNKTDEIFHILEKETKRFVPPLIDQVISQFGKDPFLILISCLISLRAKDITTIHVCRTLFGKAKTPLEILLIEQSDLEKIIFRAGFYKNKAKTVRFVSNVILKKFNGKVPCDYNDLISIKGVGPKTARLVMGMAFAIPMVCVDTHVHRISNRLGIIKTKTVEQSVMQLERVLDKSFWIKWNNFLVMWGQNICLPGNPKCRICGIKDFCKYWRSNSFANSVRKSVG